MTFFTKRLCQAAVALAIACCASAAHAVGATSTVQINGLSYELIDLQPNDAYAPSLTLRSESFGAATVYSDSDWWVSVPASEVGPSGSTSLTRPYGTASTTWDGSRHIATASLADDGTVSRGIASVNTYNVEFTLSPWTRLAITLDATLTAQPDGEHTRAQTTVTLDGGVTRSENYTWDNRFIGTYRNVESGTELAQLHGVLDSDSSAGTVVLRMESFATASIYAATTPVPEPAGYAMLVAGLGLVGVAARKRRQGRDGHSMSQARGYATQPELSNS